MVLFFVAYVLKTPAEMCSVAQHVLINFRLKKITEMCTLHTEVATVSYVVSDVMWPFYISNMDTEWGLLAILYRLFNLNGLFTSRPAAD